MKERPIILNAEMVRAVLDGRKTQTRRVIVPSMRTADTQFELHQQHDGSWVPMHTFNEDLFDGKGRERPIKCPFGSVDDRLWVRETWQGPLVDYDDAYSMFKDPTPYQKVENCVYRADGGPCPEFTDADDELRQGWRPSIHMPRWASRITLEITGVRVERLQDISQKDAIAEGGTPYFNINWYAGLWASIYGAESWQANPWVWVIDFKRMEGQA